MRLFGGKGRSRRRGEAAETESSSSSTDFEPAAGFEDAAEPAGANLDLDEARVTRLRRRDPPPPLDDDPFASEADLVPSEEDFDAAAPQDAFGAEIVGDASFGDGPPQGFEHVVAISARRHGRYGVLSDDGRYPFARDLALAPLTLPEFAEAARSYPIIFAGPARRPVAVMGLSRGGNLFLDDDDRLTVDDYVPDVFRQHPFALAPAPGPDDGETRFALCADFASPRLVEDAGAPLFEHGAPSQFARKAMRRLFDARRAGRRTASFVADLDALDVFATRPLTIAEAAEDDETREGREIGTYVAIDVDALHALDPEILARLARSGALAAIYAHALSLGGWGRVLSRAADKLGDEVAAP